MMKITMNGRAIAPGRFGEEVMKDVRRRMTDQVRQNAEKKLAGFRCSEHGKGATVKVMIANNMERGKLTVDTCCEKANEEVRRILN